MNTHPAVHVYEPEHRTPVRLTRKGYDPPPQVVKPRPLVRRRPSELAGQPLERTAGRT